MLNEKNGTSLLHIKLILCIEDEFKIKLNNSNIDKLNSFQKIVNHISKLNFK